MGGIPVTIADNGYPVTNDRTLGLPVTQAASGMHVTVVDAGGFPVAFVNDDLSADLTVAEGGGFSPSQLFSNGEAGAWFDPSDLTSMYQGRTGTTAAAVGSPVGQLLDKSGNSNHAVAPSDAARPILRQSGSLYYLEFDGVDDFLLTPNVPSLDFSSDFSLSLAMRFTGPTGFKAIAGKFVSNQQTGYDIGFSNGVPRWAVRGTSNIDTGTSGIGNQTNVDLALILSADPTQASREVNGTRVDRAGTWTAVPATSGFAIGRRGSDGSSYASMRLHNLVLRGGALGADRERLRTYLGSKIGVTL
jgi:hypothetical protein